MGGYTAEKALVLSEATGTAEGAKARSALIPHLPMHSSLTIHNVYRPCRRV